MNRRGPSYRCSHRSYLLASNNLPPLEQARLSADPKHQNNVSIEKTVWLSTGYPGQHHKTSSGNARLGVIVNPHDKPDKPGPDGRGGTESKRLTLLGGGIGRGEPLCQELSREACSLDNHYLGKKRRPAACHLPPLDTEILQQSLGNRHHDMSTWKILKDKVMPDVTFAWARPNDLNHPRPYFEISLVSEKLLMTPITITGDCVPKDIKGSGAYTEPGQPAPLWQAGSHGSALSTLRTKLVVRWRDNSRLRLLHALSLLSSTS